MSALLPSILLMTAVVVQVHAQEASSDCFDFYSFSLPIHEEAIRSAGPDVFFQPMNRLEYRDVDDHTFWYRLVAEEDMRIRFSLFSLNYEDIYDPLLFTADTEEEICLKIVKGIAEPLPLSGVPAYSYGDSIHRQEVREFSFEAEAGRSYYLSVIEIQGEGCGHKLYLNAQDRSCVFRSTRKDCDLRERRVHLENVSRPHESEDGMSSDLSEEDAVIEEEDEVGRATYDSEGATGNVELHIPRLSSPAHTADSSTLLISDSLATLSPEGHSTESIIPGADLHKGQRIVLYEILFHNNTYAFKPSSFDELSRLADFLDAYPNIILEIQGHSAGHTRKITPDPRNAGRGSGWEFKGSSHQLSEARAKAVKDHLVELGIYSHRLTTVGLGDTQKLIDTPRSLEEAMVNMRVEIVIKDL